MIRHLSKHFIMMLHTMVSSKNNVEEYSRLCNEMELEINSLLCPETTDKDSEGMCSMCDLNVSKLSRISSHAH